MKTEYNILLQKLEKFIRKYYLNQIVRGVLLAVALYLVVYLVATVTEYYSYLSVAARTVLFYTLLLLISVLFVYFILIPVLKLGKIGKRLSYKDASRIIAVHFTDVQDKLQNTLELAEQARMDQNSNDLVLASIDQRITQLRPVPFTTAIDLKKNLRYLKYLIPVLLVMLGVYLYSPAIFTEGTKRIVQYNTPFTPAPPFVFELQNDSLLVEKGGDFTVDLKISGDYVPSGVFVNIGGNSFLMSHSGKSGFKYKMKNVNNPVAFSFSAEKFSSEPYELEVLPSPLILDFNLSVNVPEYTGEQDRILDNVGDVVVPYGSVLTWNFNTKDIEMLQLIFSDSLIREAKHETSKYSHTEKALRNSRYSIIISNMFFKNREVLKYSVSVIPDLYPNIDVQSIHDSLQYHLYYFKGLINDDYGFKNLYFCYNNSDVPDSLKRIPLQINDNLTSQEFYYAFDFSGISGNSENVKYFFEVWDNDGVSGSKSARSRVYQFSLPGKEELQKFEEDANKSIQSKVEESMKLAKELKKDINKMREDLVNDNATSWEKTQMIEQIAQKQKSLEQLLDQLSNENAQKNEMINTFSEQEEELLKKQEQIQELLENIMDEELKDLLDKFNELMENFSQDKLNELTKDMEMSYEEMEEQLDRNLELLKQYEIEQKIENVKEQLEDLAKEQEQLSQETDTRKMDEQQKEDALKKQQEQAEKFDKLMEEYKEAQEKNKELETPMNLDEMNQQKEDIKNEFQQGSENLQKGAPKKASGNQKQNSDNLQKMAQQMQNMMQQNAQSQSGENMEDLRQIIDNLVTFSFEQEDLLQSIENLKNKDPRYVEAINTQNKLKEDFEVLKDSLKALAKRTPQLNSAITKELADVDRNVEKALANLEERKTAVARSDQQFVMTSANNLALLLAEVLKQMQQQMAQQMQGNSSCQKPGQGQPSLSQMRSQQQSLKGQLESMIEQMKGGKNGKDGKDGKFDKDALNKKLSQMLAQQEVFRKTMGDMMKNGSYSPETVKKLNEINKMIEQNETDLVNKNITPALLKRQQMIVTRLLEAENSEQQREIEKKRESREGKNDNFSNPKEIFEYKGVNYQLNELLNTNNLKLNKYYKDKYKEYLINLNESQ